MYDGRVLIILSCLPSFDRYRLFFVDFSSGLAVNALGTEKASVGHILTRIYYIFHKSTSSDFPRFCLLYFLASYALYPKYPRQQMHGTYAVRTWFGLLLVFSWRERHGRGGGKIFSCLSCRSPSYNQNEPAAACYQLCIADQHIRHDESAVSPARGNAKNPGFQG